MADQPKISAYYLVRVARDLAVGESGFYPVAAMRVDPDFRCWIDPFATSIGMAYAGGQPLPIQGAYLTLTRVEGGFQVDMAHAIERQFSIDAKPEMKFGEYWIPVVEFTGAKG